MSRPLRMQYPGALYRITSRDNAKHKIFLNKEDYQNFLIILSDTVKRYNWICYAYCLMPNHYHLLIETPDANLAAGMRQLNGIYTQKFNFIHKRVGHIFQGRYKAILVEKERNELIYKANVSYGYSLSEIGKKPGMHYTSISVTMKKNLENENK